MFVRTDFVVILICCSVSVDSALAKQAGQGEEEKKDQSAHWLPAAMFQEDPGDDELTRLLKERYRVAADEVAALKVFLAMGIGDPSAHLKMFDEAEGRTARAALELCKTTEQRVNVLQRVVDSRKRTEAFFDERFKGGRDSASVLYRARHDRLDAEIELAREKLNGAKDKK